jgi:hypothetical protein
MPAHECAVVDDRIRLRRKRVADLGAQTERHDAQGSPSTTSALPTVTQSSSRRSQSVDSFRGR